MTPSSPTITCDPDAKALYIRFSDSSVHETIELAGNVYLDMDNEGRIIGIEILNANPELLSSLPPLPDSVEPGALLDP